MTQRTLIAGIGCRRQVAAEDIVGLVDQALGAAESGRDALAALAAPRFKEEEPALHEAAAALGVGLTIIDETAMETAQAHTLTRSACAERTFGIASIAEGAALAAAGPGAVLVLPRIGNGRATCALARRSS
jgi:cobalt-precorrin 5A hydrolase